MSTRAEHPSAHIYRARARELREKATEYRDIGCPAWDETADYLDEEARKLEAWAQFGGELVHDCE